ncbi:pirin family protein [Knoellia sp. CPCC 206450]|uniref:pirin family protein n=1 Tax=Knoellia tibetensis TaxID=3404798 RepID=UPI003B4369DF
MPAVTADTLTLPRLDRPAEGATDRQVRRQVSGPKGFEGEGFPVTRAFAGIPVQELDPFVHMDEMGAVNYAPGEPRGTDWHPHRGFETVTYIMDGRFRHQDSHGGGGMIENGATQWMTAGSGVLHIETPPAELVVSGGLFHGVQLWVNLPSAKKWSDPRYQNLEGTDSTLVTTHDGGTLLRIIAGSIGGRRGPGDTHTPITMAHATISPGAQAEIPWNPAYNGLVFVFSGNGSIGRDRRPIRPGQTIVTGPGDLLTLTADERQDVETPALEVLLLGGQPIREPVVQYGPFVMNTKREVVQAFEDFRAGRLGRVPADGLRPYRPTDEELRAAVAGMAHGDVHTRTTDER